MRAALASGDMGRGERLRPRKRSPILFLKMLLPNAFMKYTCPRPGAHSSNPDSPVLSSFLADVPTTC